MNAATWSAVGWMGLWSACSCLGWAATAFAAAQVLHRNNIVDTLWGVGFCAVAVIGWPIAVSLGSGDGLRRLLMVLVVLVWGSRLSWHVGRRSWGKDDDPRYVKLLDDKPGPRPLVAIAYIFAPQTVVLFVVSWSLQVGFVEPGSVRWIGWVGLLVAVVGIGFEAIGDRQLTQFKQDPSNKGRIADIGLWGYTRHPNYFGDSLVWIGLFVIALDRWPGVLAIVSPVVMTYLLDRGTGKRLLERAMKDRPGYREYTRRTSGFVPMPKRLHERFTRG